jgi:hypothetical protein
LTGRAHTPTSQISRIKAALFAFRSNDLMGHTRPFGYDSEFLAVKLKFLQGAISSINVLWTSQPTSRALESHRMWKPCAFRPLK